MVIHMNCNETQKEIQPFLDWELNDDDAQEFIEHLYECPQCKEEFAIQYLIAEGMKHLEDGSAFNLNKEMELRLGSSLTNIHKRRKYNYVMLSIQGVAVLVMMLLCLFVLY